MMASGARGLNLGDAMILVAATALGCCQVDWDAWNSNLAFASERNSYGSWRSVFNATVYPFWLPWTYAVLVISLRPPRPTWRRLVRRPGMVVTLLISCSAPFFLAQSILNLNRFGVNVQSWRPGMRIPTGALLTLPCPLALLVIGAWVALVLTGRWRVRVGPIDWFGRVVGFGWIACFLADEVENLFGPSL